MSKGRKQKAMLILNKIEGHGAAEEVHILLMKR